MPTYHSFEWEGFMVKAEPSGIRKLFGFLPYFTGSEPAFKITVYYTGRGKVPPFATTVDFYEPDYTAKEQRRMLSISDKPVTNISENIKVHPIGVPGDHRFPITLDCPGKGRCQRDLVTFTAISGDKTTMTFFGFLILFSGTILGGIIGSLITHFFFP